MSVEGIAIAFIAANGLIAGAVTAALRGIKSMPVLPKEERLDWTGANVRKRNAKRMNEHLKLIATFLNNAALAGIATGLLAPYANGRDVFGWKWYALVLISSCALLVFAHLTLRLWQSEE